MPSQENNINQQDLEQVTPAAPNSAETSNIQLEQKLDRIIEILQIEQEQKAKEKEQQAKEQKVKDEEEQLKEEEQKAKDEEQKAKDEEHQQLLQANSTEQLTYQEQILLRFDESIYLQKLGFVGLGVVIALGCVIIFQNHMNRG